MSKRSTVGDDVEGWLASKGSDRLADYATRGRKHQNLTIEELTAAWVHAFRSMVDNVRDPERRAVEEDFTSELLLRKSEPPYQLVREEFERFTAECDRAMRDLETEDPSRFEEMAKEIDRDLETFKSTRDRTKS
jgi:CRISPR/Cas system CSM-associated protein Csm2 small subunit